MLTDLIALDPGSSSAFALLGDVERSLGRLDEAERHLRTALELNPNHPMALLTLATCVREKGNLAEADELLQRRISLSPYYGRR